NLKRITKSIRRCTGKGINLIKKSQGFSGKNRQRKRRCADFFVKIYLRSTKTKVLGAAGSSRLYKLVLFLYRLSLSQTGIQDLFADTQRLGSNLQKLIRVNEFQRLL